MSLSGRLFMTVTHATGRYRWTDKHGIQDLSALWL